MTTLAVLAVLLLAPAGVSTSASSPFFTGPAGRGVILPPAGSRLLLGVTQAGSDALVRRDVTGLERSIGRALDIEHLFMQNTCTLALQSVNAVVRRGHIPMISWLPGNSNGGAVLRGAADSCIAAIGRQIAKQPHRLFLRPFFEFNGDWLAHSRDLDGSLLTDVEHRTMWRRMVTVLRKAGAFPKASIVWCPAEGPYGNFDGFDESRAYPGDAYVDWVCAAGYNWNAEDSWCGARGSPHPGWCEFGEIFHDVVSPGGNVEMDFRGRKPVMIGETGSVEGRPAQKGQWFRNARDYIRTSMPGLHAFVYFDIDFDANWRIRTSPSSVAGFRELARSRQLRPHARTP